MRTMLLLALLAAVGIAGAAQAHYLVEQETPVGNVCAMNMEIILDGARSQDPDTILEGVVTSDCE